MGNSGEWRMAEKSGKQWETAEFEDDESQGYFPTFFLSTVPEEGMVGNSGE